MYLFFINATGFENNLVNIIDQKRVLNIDGKKCFYARE